jgi:hypothetical protein
VTGVNHEERHNPQKTPAKSLLSKTKLNNKKQTNNTMPQIISIFSIK